MQIQFRQKVAFRYVTVKLIDIDNRMEEMNDQHPDPNIDVKNITFNGTLIPSNSAEFGLDLNSI
jgi:hypothetical protein